MNNSPKRVLAVAVFSVTMLVLAAAGSAVMDTLQSRYSVSVFSGLPQYGQWFDPVKSWRNKWKDGDPSNGEAFPLSSTALVSMTDAWHFFKTVTVFSILLAVLAPFTLIVSLSRIRWLAIFAGLYLLYGLVFESFYGWVLRR